MLASFIQYGYGNVEVLFPLLAHAWERQEFIKTRKQEEFKRNGSKVGPKLSPKGHLPTIREEAYQIDHSR